MQTIRNDQSLPRQIGEVLHSKLLIMQHETVEELFSRLCSQIVCTETMGRILNMLKLQKDQQDFKIHKKSSQTEPESKYKTSFTKTKPYDKCLQILSKTSPAQYRLDCQFFEQNPGKLKTRVRRRQNDLTLTMSDRLYSKLTEAREK